MRATIMFGAGDVRIENVPDAHLIEPTDALVRITRAAICGSDLWPYNPLPHTDEGRRMGHEFIDVVGAEVRTVKAGDVVVAPFLYSDGTCVFCLGGCTRHASTAAGTEPTTSTAARANPHARTSRNCCPTCSRHGSSPAACSTARRSRGVPDGYRAMNDREAIKVLIEL